MKVIYFLSRQDSVLMTVVGVWGVICVLFVNDCENDVLSVFVVSVGFVICL